MPDLCVSSPVCNVVTDGGINGYKINIMATDTAGLSVATWAFFAPFVYIFSLFVEPFISV